MEFNTTFYFKNSRLPSFVPIPRSVMKSDLSATAKLMYGLLLSRTQLSANGKNSDTYTDGNNAVFVFYTIAQLSKDLNKSATTVKAALNELAESRLIIRISQGRGKAKRIYLLLPIENWPEAENTITEGLDFPDEDIAAFMDGKLTWDGQKMTAEPGQIPPTNNKDFNNNGFINAGGIRKTNPYISYSACEVPDEE